MADGVTIIGVVASGISVSVRASGGVAIVGRDGCVVVAGIVSVLMSSGGGVVVSGKMVDDSVVAGSVAGIVGGIMEVMVIFDGEVVAGSELETTGILVDGTVVETSGTFVAGTELETSGILVVGTVVETTGIVVSVVVSTAICAAAVFTVVASVFKESGMVGGVTNVSTAIVIASGVIVFASVSSLGPRLVDTSVTTTTTGSAESSPATGSGCSVAFTVSTLQEHMFQSNAQSSGCTADSVGTSSTSHKNKWHKCTKSVNRNITIRMEIVAIFTRAASSVYDDVVDADNGGRRFSCDGHKTDEPDAEQSETDLVNKL